MKSENQSISIPIIWFIILFVPLNSWGQEYEYEYSNEVGAGFGVSYIIGAGEFEGAFNVHYMRNFGKQKRFSIAPGFEAVFDEDGYVSANVAYGYRPIDFLYLALAPGIKFSREEPSEFIAGFKLLYEMSFRYFQAGPLFEYDWSPGNQYLLLGLYFGLGF